MSQTPQPRCCLSIEYLPSLPRAASLECVCLSARIRRANLPHGLSIGNPPSQSRQVEAALAYEPAGMSPTVSWWTRRRASPHRCSRILPRQTGPSVCRTAGDCAFRRGGVPSHESTRPDCDSVSPARRDACAESSLHTTAQPCFVRRSHSVLVSAVKRLTAAVTLHATLLNR